MVNNMTITETQQFIAMLVVFCLKRCVRKHESGLGLSSLRKWL